MVDTGIFATTAEVQYKVGANASTTANTETYINSFMTQAESYINTITRFNWSDRYSSLNVDVKGILKEAASCWAAIMVINFDPTSIGRAQAQARIDVLYDRANKMISLLNDQEVRKFLVGA